MYTVEGAAPEGRRPQAGVNQTRELTTDDPVCVSQNCPAPVHPPLYPGEPAPLCSVVEDGVGDKRALDENKLTGNAARFWDG